MIFHKLILFVPKIHQIYSSCEESYRLTASGDLNVPYDYTEQYCEGPCLSETHLVLNCIENILSHFVFYNRATIYDIRDTIKAGCSYGPERGSLYTYPIHTLSSYRMRISRLQYMTQYGIFFLVGHFNVLEHMEENSAEKTGTAFNILLRFGLMIITTGLWLRHLV